MKSLKQLVNKNSLFRELLAKQPKDLKEIETFFESNERHHNLLQQYFPLRDIDSQELIKRTAARVGLEVPKDNNSP
jgi:tRNA U34 2-thiouridine synthase MnmA/TrmU